MNREDNSTQDLEYKKLLQEIKKLRFDVCLSNIILALCIFVMAVCIVLGLRMSLNTDKGVVASLNQIIASDKSNKDEAKVLHMTLSSEKDTEELGCTQDTTDKNSCLITVWTKSSQKAQPDFAQLENGVVHITKNGTYFTYIQISYSQKRGHFSFAVFTDDVEFLKCTWTEWGIEVESVHPCHSSAATYLSENQTVSVRYWDPDSNILTLDMSTFWGIVKLS